MDQKGFVFVVTQKMNKLHLSPLGIVGNLLKTQTPPSILGDLSKIHLQSSMADSASILEHQPASSAPRRSGGVGLSNFVFRLVQQGLKSRNSPLPGSLVWYTLAMFLGDFFLFGTRNEANTSLLPDPRDAEKLRSMLNINGKFSRNRCGLILPKVKEIYYTDLPALYTSEEHNARICRALQAFYAHARGPMVNYYRNLLIEEFSLFWRNGRQRCEAKSLTGHYCKYSKHNAPENVETDADSSQIDVRKHCSEFVSVGACNCGKTRKTRIDPFTLVDANCNFFQSRCCARYQRSELPKLASDFDHWSLLSLGNSRTYSPTVGILQDGFKMRYKLLVPYELNSPTSRLSLPQQAVHSEEDFPSLQPTSRQHRGRGHDTMQSPSRNRAKQQGDGAGGWIGYEYECPTGHRFIEPLHSIMNAAKQTGNYPEVLSIEIAFRTEMPLFANCRSKSKKNCGLAKLQRVFVTTPIKVALKINPVVHIIGKFSGNVQKLNFSLGCQVPIPNDSFVCLRLPYVYEYDNQPLQNKQNANSPFQCSFRLVG